MNQTYKRYGGTEDHSNTWSTVGDRRSLRSQNSFHRVNSGPELNSRRDIRYTLEELLSIYQPQPIAPDLVGRPNILEEPFEPICLGYDGADELKKMWAQRAHNEYGNTRFNNTRFHKQRDHMEKSETEEVSAPTELVRMDSSTLDYSNPEEANAHKELKMRQKEMLLKKLKQHSTSVSPRPDPEPEELLSSEVVVSEVVPEVASEVVSGVASEVVASEVVSQPMSQPRSQPRSEPVLKTVSEPMPKTMSEAVPSSITEPIPSSAAREGLINTPVQPLSQPRAAPWSSESLGARELYYEQLLNSLLWYYVDCQEKVQGPFPTKQMRYWFETGSFFDTLYVSFKRDEWKMLKEYYPRIELAFLVLPATS